jgi:hypothetical protein
MYEIINNEREVNGKTIDTFKREIYNANILEVEAGTNGYQGGDTGHGSRTYIRIQDMGATDISVHVTHDQFGCEDGVVISLGGDSELNTMIEALRFILKVLDDQSREVDR